MRHPVLYVLAVAVILCSASTLRAQSIDPGMNKVQVVERLGQPFAERTAGAFTYLFYSNGREYERGMSDLIILQNDAVVDAIFRSPSRSYTGRSSSPEDVMPVKSVPSGERLSMPYANPSAGAAPATPNGAAPAPPSPAPPDTTRSP
jgi:hypothetical protein